MTITICDLCKERAEYERQTVAVRIEGKEAVPCDRTETGLRCVLDLCVRCRSKLLEMKAIL